MKIIRHGFDGLEFAIKTTITHELDATLKSAQEQARETDSECGVQFGDRWIVMHQMGARGGYTYRCTDQQSGTWFFKKPSARDPWGIRFSASSHALAIKGLEGVRNACEALLNAMGVEAEVTAYVPSRVDFAIDFLLPAFSPNPEQFVSHSHTGRKTVAEFEHIETNGVSNRITSVTVDKMPGRQVILYNKSKEILEKRKPEWLTIWRKCLGDDAHVLEGATVWRAEIRVAKRHFKDVWHVDGWRALYDLLVRIYLKLLEDLRYSEIGSDSNRSRWKEHKIWRKLRDIVENDLFDHIPTISATEYVEIKRLQKIDEFRKQALGLLTSAAAIEGITEDDFSQYLDDAARAMLDTARLAPTSLEEKLAKAAEGYRHLT